MLMLLSWQDVTLSTSALRVDTRSMELLLRDTRAFWAPAALAISRQAFASDFSSALIIILLPL